MPMRLIRPGGVNDPGHFSWSCTRDQEGHRDYKLKFRVQQDRPVSVLQLVGTTTINSNAMFPVTGLFASVPQAGWLVTCAAFPAGTTVTSATPSQIRMSTNATTTNTSGAPVIANFRSVQEPPAGPQQALACPGLPTVGSWYIIGADLDLWAWCRWDASATMVDDKENTRQFIVEVTFSSKPTDIKRCITTPPGDPTQDLPEISGGSSKYTEEATFDMFGQPVVNSAWEQLRGQTVEFDRNRGKVKVKQNFSSFSQITLAYQMLDCVNGYPLWGMPPRCIKLSGVDWKKHWYARCSFYYERTLDYDVSMQGLNEQQINATIPGIEPGPIAIGFDRFVLDEGTKVLSGRWNRETAQWQRRPVPPTATLNPDAAGNPVPGVPINPDPNNPSHFVKFPDRQGNPIKGILNGLGEPWNPAALELVNTCALCAGGAPKKWQVLGLDTVVTGPIFLDYQAGCVWTGLDGDGNTFTLSGLPPGGAPGNVWSLTCDNAALFPVGYVNWVQAPLPPYFAAWKCLGPNLLKFNGQPQVFKLPAEVTLEAVPPDSTTNKPGQIFVAKYQNANFLLLGIPSTI